MRPALILVGADKGGVGKTTVSRVLLDYLTERAIPARAFDTESPRGTLTRFYPDTTEIVDLDRTNDQMRGFDTLDQNDIKVTLVDVRAGQLKTMLGALREFGFFEAVREGKFDFLLFHILGSSVASLEEIAEMAPFVGDAQYFLVKNHIGEGTYFEWDPNLHRAYFDRATNATELTIPKLNELAYEQIDVAGSTFSQFVQDTRNSFVLRGYVRSWRQSVTMQLDDAAVGGAFGRKRPVTAPAPPPPAPVVEPPITRPAIDRPALRFQPPPTPQPTPPAPEATAVPETSRARDEGPTMSRLEEISEMLHERLRALEKVVKDD